VCVNFVTDLHRKNGYWSLDMCLDLLDRFNSPGNVPVIKVLLEVIME
jgi:hypothetical protein